MIALKRMATRPISQQHLSGNTLGPDEVSKLERHGYLFGQKITHSLSPFLHDVIYQNLGLKWGQVRLDSADMNNFLELIKHPNFYGEYSSTVFYAECVY